MTDLLSAIRLGRVESPNDTESSVSVLSLEECCHGDTLGVMEVSTPNVFNTGQHPWYHGRSVSALALS